MIALKSKQSATTADEFAEHYGITPHFFVRHCLLPSLFALRRVSCFYHGVLVETLEAPAWKTRLRALHTVFAMASAEEIQEKRIKIPLGALGPAQLAPIADALLKTDCCPIGARFLVVNCLRPALEAVNTAYLFYLGRQVDSLQFQDWGTKLEALTIACKARKLFAIDSDNLHFATYRDIALLVSEAQRKSRAIQIVRETQLVYVR